MCASGPLISVAFWGEQADDFNYLQSTILEFRNVEITNFKGLSLSVMKKSRFHRIDEDSYPYVNQLINWLNTKWLNENPKKSSKVVEVEKVEKKESGKRCLVDYSDEEESKKFKDVIDTLSQSFSQNSLKDLKDE